jgi:hypothetical protein
MCVDVGAIGHDLSLRGVMDAASLEIRREQDVREIAS